MNQFADDKTCLTSIKLLADFWTLRIIDALQDGELRFCELQRSTGNLNPVTLTSRLKKLEEADVVNRVEDTEDKVSVSYSLTPKGNKAVPVLKAINNFSAPTKSTRS
jgi:DNA-binding HxlR family transcriptional regulator